MLPAYVVVIGSAHRESVEAQLSFVKLRTWTSDALRSGGELGIPFGRSTHVLTSSVCGVPIALR